MFYSSFPLPVILTHHFIVKAFVFIFVWVLVQYEVSKALPNVPFIPQPRVWILLFRMTAPYHCPQSWSSSFHVGIVKLLKRLLCNKDKLTKQSLSPQKNNTNVRGACPDHNHCYPLSSGLWTTGVKMEVFYFLNARGLVHIYFSSSHPLNPWQHQIIKHSPVTWRAGDTAMASFTSFVLINKNML